MSSILLLPEILHYKLPTSHEASQLWTLQLVPIKGEIFQLVSCCTRFRYGAMQATHSQVQHKQNSLKFPRQQGITPLASPERMISIKVCASRYESSVKTIYLMFACIPYKNKFLSPILSDYIIIISIFMEILKLPLRCLCPGT